MEPDGQAATQIPQPLQSTSLILAFFFAVVEGDRRVGAQRHAGLAAASTPPRRRARCWAPARRSPASMRARASAAAAPAWATVSGMSFGPWQAPAMKTPSVKVLTGASLGWRLQEQAFGAAAHVEQPAHRLRVGLRLQAGGQHDHVHRNAAHEAGQGVLHADHQLAFLLRRHGPVGDLGHAAADELHALARATCRRTPRSPCRGADVDVEDCRPPRRCVP